MKPIRLDGTKATMAVICNPVTAALLETALCKSGFSVRNVSASDVRAVRALQNDPPDAAIFDDCVREKENAHILKLLQACRVPIIVYSSAPSARSVPETAKSATWLPQATSFETVPCEAEVLISQNGDSLSVWQPRQMAGHAADEKKSEPKPEEISPHTGGRSDFAEDRQRSLREKRKGIGLRRSDGEGRLIKENGASKDERRQT